MLDAARITTPVNQQIFSTEELMEIKVQSGQDFSKMNLFFNNKLVQSKTNPGATVTFDYTVTETESKILNITAAGIKTAKSVPVLSNEVTVTVGVQKEPEIKSNFVNSGTPFKISISNIWE
jgi:hypothetical protein